MYVYPSIYNRCLIPLSEVRESCACLSEFMWCVKKERKAEEREGETERARERVT